jgi:hypothetical protein
LNLAAAGGWWWWCNYLLPQRGEGGAFNFLPGRVAVVIMLAGCENKAACRVQLISCMPKLWDPC